MGKADKGLVGLVELAEAKFGKGKDKLNPAERKFFKGVGDGEVVDFRKGDAEVDKPENASKWRGRKIRSEKVAWLCTDSEALGMVTHKGVRVFGARFDEELDLSYAQMPFGLLFERCVFAKKINLEMASAREINFSGSHTKAINGDSLNVEGWIYLANGFRAEGEVSLLDAKAGGLQCGKGEFVNSGGYALNCGRIEIIGDVLLRNGFSSEGEVSFLGATIGGNLSCINGKFSKTEGDALNCDGIEVKGSVLLRNGFSSKGVVRFLDAKIGGTYDCINSTFSSSNGYSLYCDRIEVKGSVFLREGFSSEGEVSFLGATIGGNLECDKGKFIHLEGKALSCDGIEVTGGVFLRDGFSSKGEVRFLGAKISGNFECDKSKFINSTGKALHCDGIEVKGGVFLRDGFSSIGVVRFLVAMVGADFDCSKGMFSNSKQQALNCERMAVKGNIFFSKSANVEGSVVLDDVTVGSNVHFQDCTLNQQEGLSVLHLNRTCVEGDVIFERVKFVGDVELGGCKVKGELKWKGITEKKPVVLDLQYGEVGTLNDESKSWPKKVLQHGFVYKEMHSGAPRSAEECIEWVRLQPDYYPGPYEQAAKVLRGGGHEDAAKDVLIAMNEDRVSRGTGMRWYSFAGLWYKVLGPMIGFGYRPWRALYEGPIRKYEGRCRVDRFLVRSIGSIMFWIFWGCVFFGVGYYCDCEIMRPVRARVFKEGYTDNRDANDDYPAFQFLTYSVDMFVPVVDLHQGKYWLPSANRGAELITIGSLTITWGGVLLCYMWVHIAAGWVLSTLLVLGFTGVVRK